MQQNELANLLGVSSAMVSKLKKQGMPVDDLDRAKRWRKRHLEPGRIKGSRFDPTKPVRAMINKPAAPTPVAAVLPDELMAEVEAAGVDLDKALANGDQEWATVMVQQVRELLRKNAREFDPDDKSKPRLSLRVWVALCSYVLIVEGMIETATNPGELLNPVQFSRRQSPSHPPYPLENHHMLCHACDWEDYALNGWPPEWVAMADEP